MKVFRYSKWDGSQAQFSLDADRALDALGELMMHGLSLQQALEHARMQGLAGKDFRVMGMRELTQQVHRGMHKLFERYTMEHALDEPQQQLDDILDDEHRTLESEQGYESQAMNDFMQRRTAPAPTIAQAIEHFADYDFHDEDAGERYDALRETLEALRALERFVDEHGMRFRGEEPADYDVAQRIRERFEAAEQTMQALRSGQMHNVDPHALRDLLDEPGMQSLMILRDLEDSLRERGYMRTQDGPMSRPILSASSKGPRGNPYPSFMVRSISSMVATPSIRISQASLIIGAIRRVEIIPGDSTTGIMVLSRIRAKRQTFL